MLKTILLSATAACCFTGLTACETTQTASVTGPGAMERSEAMDISPRNDDPSTPQPGGLRVSEGVPPLAVKEF